jgi:hypothetical protein
MLAQQALRLPYATLPFPDSPVKDLPRREHISAEGGLLEAAQLGTIGPGRGQPDVRPPGGDLQDIERGERSRMIRQVVLFR